MTQNRSILMIGNFLYNKTGIMNINEELSVILRNDGWRIIKTSSHKIKILKMIDMIYSVFKNMGKYNIAIIEVYSGKAFIWAEIITFILDKMNKKIVLTLHGGNLPFFYLNNQSRVNKTFKKATYITTPSEYLYEKMKIDKNKVMIIRNAIDHKKYNYIQRKKLRPILIWMRAFHKIYNPEMAIKVIIKLLENRDDVRMIMLGPDKKDGSFNIVQELIKKNNLENIVEIVGKIEKKDISKWLNKGDIYINTSIIDNTPVSLIEAMACGLCIISNNVGGIPYILKNEENSLLIKMNDINGMSLNIERLLIDSKLSRKISRNGYQTSKEFNCREVYNKWNSLINHVSHT
jgi:glycosyltransferase involved in cell wall biosynthesis